MRRNSDLKKLFIGPDDSVAKALDVMEKSLEKIALVVNDGSFFQGTVTDGDIRRGLLAGFTLESNVSTIMNKNPVVARSESELSLLKKGMYENRYRHIPVVDHEGRLMGLEWLFDIVKPKDDLDHTAIIMAGGKGKRLGSLTTHTPKPMLHLSGKPILEHIVDRMRLSGIKKFIFCVNYLFEQIESHFGDGSNKDCHIEYVRESKPLGTAGALGLVKMEKNLTSPFIVANADLMTHVDFRNLVESHDHNGVDVTVCVRQYTHQIPFGTITLDPLGKVLDIQEKPEIVSHVNAGIYMFAPQILEKIETNRYLDMPDLIKKLISEHHKVDAYHVFEPWIDVGCPEDLKRASKDFA